MRFSFLKGIFIPLLIITSFVVKTEVKEKTPPEWLVKAVLPKTESIKYDENKGLYTGYNENGEIVGYATSGEKLGILPHGYSGEINILVGISSDGKLSGFAILSHSETEEYLMKVMKSPQARNLIGKDFRDPFVVGYDIDGVSRASITWSTITYGLSEITKELAKISGIGETNVIEKKKDVPLKNTILVFFAMIIATFTSSIIPRNIYLRYLSLIISTTLLVLIVGIFLSSQSIMPILMLKPIFIGQLSMYMLFTIVLISTILKSRIYCGYACPLSLIFDIIYRIQRYTKIPKLTPPETIDRTFGMFKYIILITILILCIRYFTLEPAGGEPFALLTLTTVKISVIIVSTIIFITTFFNPYLFCKYLCGTGALLSSFATFTIIRPKILNSCNKCGKCVDNCPLNCIKRVDNIYRIEISNCIRCGECVRTCPEKAIKL
ncbi:MAG: FMN-binding protein [bacterium]